MLFYIEKSGNVSIYLDCSDQFKRVGSVLLDRISLWLSSRLEFLQLSFVQPSGKCPSASWDQQMEPRSLPYQLGKSNYNQNLFQFNKIRKSIFLGVGRPMTKVPSRTIATRQFFSLDTSPTSQHYGTEGFMGAPSIGLPLCWDMQVCRTPDVIFPSPVWHLDSKSCSRKKKVWLEKVVEDVSWIIITCSHERRGSENILVLPAILYAGRHFW